MKYIAKKVREFYNKIPLNVKRAGMFLLCAGLLYNPVKKFGAPLKDHLKDYLERKKDIISYIQKKSEKRADWMYGEYLKTKEMKDQFKLVERAILIKKYIEELRKGPDKMDYVFLEKLSLEIDKREVKEENIDKKVIKYNGTDVIVIQKEKVNKKHFKHFIIVPGYINQNKTENTNLDTVVGENGEEFYVTPIDDTEVKKELEDMIKKQLKFKGPVNFWNKE